MGGSSKGSEEEWELGLGREEVGFFPCIELRKANTQNTDSSLSPPKSIQVACTIGEADQHHERAGPFPGNSRCPKTVMIEKGRGKVMETPPPFLGRVHAQS